MSRQVDALDQNRGIQFKRILKKTQKTSGLKSNFNLLFYFSHFDST